MIRGLHEGQILRLGVDYRFQHTLSHGLLLHV